MTSPVDDKPVDSAVFDREVYRPALSVRVSMGLGVSAGVFGVVAVGWQQVMSPGPLAVVAVAGVAWVFLIADALSGVAIVTMQGMRVRTLFRAEQVAWQDCRGIWVAGQGEASTKWTGFAYPVIGGVIGGVLTQSPRLGLFEAIGITFITMACAILALHWLTRRLFPASRVARTPLSGIVVTRTDGRQFRLVGLLGPGTAEQLRGRLESLGIETFDGPLDGPGTPAT